MEICWNQRRKNNAEVIFFIPSFIFLFSSLCFGKHVFMDDKKLHSYIIILFHKLYINSQKKYVWVFKQLSNHNYVSIYGVCKLKKHVTMPWSHCKLVFYFVFNCWAETYRKSLKPKVKYAWITLRPVHLCFLKPRLFVGIKT